MALFAYLLAFATYYPTGGPAWLLVRGQRHHALALASRGIYLQPFEMTQLDRDGRWDQEPLISSLKQPEFPAIPIWKRPHARGIYRKR